MAPLPTPSARLLDHSAIGLSGLCLVHCLALPLAVVALPGLALAAQAEWIHGVFVLVAAPLSAAALMRTGGWSRLTILAPALAGLALLGLGAFVPSLGSQETALTMGGGLCLALAHLLNIRRHAH